MEDDAFLSEIAKQHRKMRERIWVVTPQEAERLRREYPKDITGDYKHIDPAEFFDGAL